MLGCRYALDFSQTTANGLAIAFLFDSLQAGDLFLLDLVLDPTSIGDSADKIPPMTVAWVFAGVVLSGVLLAAYWRGWELARHSAVVMMTLLIGFATPDPFVIKYASVAVFLPPVVALVLTNSTWVILSAVSTITIFACSARSLANPNRAARSQTGTIFPRRLITPLIQADSDATARGSVNLMIS